MGATATAYHAGLKAYFAGDYDTAVKQLDAALAASPANATAIDYRNRAAEHASFLPIWALTAIGVVAAALLGLGALLVWRRGRRSSDSSIPAAGQATPAPAGPGHQNRPAPFPPARPMPQVRPMSPARPTPPARPAAAAQQPMPARAGAQNSGAQNSGAQNSAAQNSGAPNGPVNRPTSVMLDPLNQTPRCSGCARPLQAHTAFCAWCGSRRTR